MIIFSILNQKFSVCDDGGALQARGGVAAKYEIGKNKTATCTILDDDHRGNFGFEETALTVEESCGHLEINVSAQYLRIKFTEVATFLLHL